MVLRAARSLIYAAQIKEEHDEPSSPLTREPGEAVKKALFCINSLPLSTDARVEQVELLDNAWLVVVSYRRT